MSGKLEAAVARWCGAGRRASRRGGAVRRGFTLVEMLVVIAIIGLVGSFVTMAVLGALKKGRESKVTLEINQLDLAIKSFRDKYGTLPWGEGTIRTDSALPTYEAEDPPYDSSTMPPANMVSSRRARILAFLSKAFPQYTANQDPSAPAGADAYTNFRYLAGRATLFHVDMSGNVDVPSFTQAVTAAANTPDFTPASRNCCDIETLDAAEVWVLCLGGVPRRRLESPGRVSFELTGFSSQPQAPLLFPITQQDLATPGLDASWQQLVAGSQRTAPFFPFPVSRLTDYDQDGWPEFVPDLPAAGAQVPPYVYFESETYNYRPMYPFRAVASPWTAPADDPNTPGADELTLIGQWGLAKPYALECTGGNNNQPWTWLVQWAESTGFQLVCAGGDGVYGGAPTGLLVGDQDAEGVQTARVSSIGQRRELGQPTPNRPMHAADADNLTNFGTGQLQDAYKKR